MSRSESLDFLRLRRDRLLVALERGHHSMPGENGALHACGILVNARKNRQLAHVTLDFSGRDHLVDLAEHLFHVTSSFAFGEFREQGARGFGDATARAREAGIPNDVAVHLCKNGVIVSAKWIVSLRGTSGLRQLLEIPRLLAVIKNDLLIEVVQVVEHAGDVITDCPRAARLQPQTMEILENAEIHYLNWLARHSFNARQAWLPCQRLLAFQQRGMRIINRTVSRMWREVAQVFLGQLP